MKEIKQPDPFEGHTPEEWKELMLGFDEWIMDNYIKHHAQRVKSKAEEYIKENKRKSDNTD